MDIDNAAGAAIDFDGLIRVDGPRIKAVKILRKIIMYVEGSYGGRRRVALSVPVTTR